MLSYRSKCKGKSSTFNKRQLKGGILSKRPINRSVGPLPRKTYQRKIIRLIKAGHLSSNKQTIWRVCSKIPINIIRLTESKCRNRITVLKHNTGHGGKPAWLSCIHNRSKLILSSSLAEHKRIANNFLSTKRNARGRQRKARLIYHHFNSKVFRAQHTGTSNQKPGLRDRIV